jgi:hypothetical protein
MYMRVKGVDFKNGAAGPVTPDKRTGETAVGVPAGVKKRTRPVLHKTTAAMAP